MEVHRIVKNMHDEFKTYQHLVKGTWPYVPSRASNWDKDRLKRLMVVLKHDKCLPLLLSVVANLSEQQFAEIVSTLERFMFRYKTIAGGHDARLGNIYYDCSKQIRTDPPDFNRERMYDQLRALILNYAGDDLFRSGLSVKLSYSPSSSAQKLKIKHFLTTIEDYYQWYGSGHTGMPRPEKHLVFDLNEISIEHIYPRNPPAEGSAPDLDTLKDDIGNLTILTPSDNTELGNADFSTKKSLNYSRSNVRINRHIATYDDWTVESISDWKERILDMAIKIFII